MYFYLYPSTLRSTWYLKTSTLQVHPVLFKKNIYYNLLFQLFSAIFLRNKFENNPTVERKKEI